LNSNLPKNGTKIRFDSFEFTILAVDSKRIKKVKVQLLSEDSEIEGHNLD
jgi:putative hemolysin